jgi:Methyltransferase domain
MSSSRSSARPWAKSWADLPVDPDMTMINPADLDPENCAAHQDLAGLGDILVVPAGSSSPAGAPNPRADSQDIRSHHGRPLLFPQVINDRVAGDEIQITLADVSDPALQYIYLNMVKNAGGEHNSPATDEWFWRHLHRAQKMLVGAKGLILDVGCDNPTLSRQLFPAGVQYVGLDPGLGPRSEPCLVGMAEFLPFRSQTLDGVAFLTSLDHVLDYQAALDEAHRVLKPGGQLFLATLIWTQRAELINDNIHFHHFRQYEIEGALAAFRIDQITRHVWKGDDHRFGAYLMATKTRA